MKFWGIKFVAVFLLLTMTLSVHAQQFEIKAFEKQNKEMLKMLKKTYGVKPEVKISEEGLFYIILPKKINKYTTRYMLADEAGELLYPNEIDSYKPIKGGYFYVGQRSGGKTLYGAVDSRGRLLLPIQYDDIQHSMPLPAGTFQSSSSTYYHPASEEFWLAIDKSSAVHHNTFYNGDASQTMYEYDGEIKAFKSYFWTIDPANAGDNQKGLLAFDGRVIYPQEYNDFYLETSGLVNCMKREADGLVLYGGKMLDSTVSPYDVPPVFRDVTYRTSSNRIECQMHRDESYFPYDPSIAYEPTWRDKGERLFDRGRYQDVITYYEGEGYGSVWGYYYMGLSAKHIADTEMGKMDNCINTLNSSNNYYDPIQNPDKYKFDAGTISGMYSSASSYLGRFINESGLDEGNPYLINAKKLRGETVTKSATVTKRIDDYGVALRNANNRKIEHDRQVAEQQRLQQIRAQQISRSVSNLTNSLMRLGRR